MEREQHTVVLEGATLTMGEELFQPSPTTAAIVGCCRDLYERSLETFIFALVFSGKVGVYQKRTGIPGEKPTPIAEGLTKGFEERLHPFGDRNSNVITVQDILTNRRDKVAVHIGTINLGYRVSLVKWEQYFVREVWMYSLAEAQKKGIEQKDTSLENELKSNEELENQLYPGYVESMLAAVRRSIGNRTPHNDVVARFIRKNTVAHIAAHCAYKAALGARDDLGENRSLLPHPTRQTLVEDSVPEGSAPDNSVRSLMQFVVPSILHEIVVTRGVRDQDVLRQHLGAYTTDHKMIEIERKVAQALVGSKDERMQLLRELSDATKELLIGNIFPSVDAGIRTLALMRAIHVKGMAEYAKALERVFPALKIPPPAESDPFLTTNL